MTTCSLQFSIRPVSIPQSCTSRDWGEIALSSLSLLILFFPDRYSCQTRQLLYYEIQFIFFLKSFRSGYYYSDKGILAC